VDSDGDGNPDNEAMMPYHSVEEMTPEAILAYYDGIAGKDGEMGFYDWIQEATGTKMLKAQHPEMETYLQSVHAQNGLSCADCHMSIEMQEDGTVNHSHKLVSPLASQTILSTCVQCHGSTNMVEKVHRIQDAVTARETVIGNKLAAFKNAFADALSAGNLSEQKIATLHKLHREAQWFFDFCYVENSEGAHNSALANHCLDLAEEKISEGMALLGEG
jgi:nitrite reductase (cytochrome c-552)